ncbi:MAG: hypothetical protein LBO06_05225 [Bacteroidales bacterium]|jgi:hypothetical protein|nr:hypothetical protein [Bacteroidales bacterium]
MKNEITKIKVGKSNAYQIGRMIEDVCDKYNLHNYFGLISTAVAQATEMAFYKLKDEDKLEFSFAQCIGGMSFALLSESNVFADLDFNQDIAQSNDHETPESLIKVLTNEVYVLEEGKGLEMVFYVNGIEMNQLQNRQSKFKNYFLKTLIQN